MARKSKAERELDELVEQAIISVAVLNDAMIRNGVRRRERRAIMREIGKAVTYATDGSTG